ncbi:MAG: gamma-glutamyltransferase [Pelagibacteraceae bacterium]|nr:gamma-glutamyltransferase [Pelagibacteraceae bacterium]PPR51672.1 MAG: putative gamma-glutamyltransferase YwrD [Alphaproteobacteria bacterium MarineAlpha5_Bin10]|tara:strand:- start:5897 stop:7483 length:1587 start_codon:yes stop_codon:yes gene_type:complete
MRNFQLPGRSNILSEKGIAATSHPLASLEAISVLKNGGNAIDAAIAASAVLSVVEPNATGIGGDCFAIIAPEGKNPVSFNGSGIASEKSTFEFFKKNNINKIDLESPHSVTIPGALDAWSCMHKNYGKMDFEKLFITAIKYAEEGFYVTEVVSSEWQNNIKKLSNNKNSKKIFLKNGKSFNFAEKHCNEALSQTLKIVSKKGARAFYEGDIANDIVESLNEIGGNHTLEDFYKQKTIVDKTIFCNYKNLKIHQCPPNGPGITVLIMMKIMEAFEISQYDKMSVERFHLEAEATKLAYQLREKNIGDPNFKQIDIDEILSPKTIEDLIKKISIKECYNIGELNIPAHPETVYLTVVDRDLNTVSFINSICFAFGSGITTNKTGVLLQNRGTNFRIEKDHPNCIDSLKRPLHTIIPGMVMDNNNEVNISYGVMGGQFQPVGQTHLLNNIIDYKMDIQGAIDFPRGFYFNNQYNLEEGISENIKEQLRVLGHKTVNSQSPIGGGQVILIDKDKGLLIGGSDSRKDGCAIGL